MEAGGSESASIANLDKVDHVVIVMLENRSFDHMLGYLALTGRRPDIDGLRPGLANEHRGHTYPVHHLADEFGKAEPVLRLLAIEFEHVRVVLRITQRDIHGAGPNPLAHGIAPHAREKACIVRVRRCRPAAPQRQ